MGAEGGTKTKVPAVLLMAAMLAGATGGVGASLLAERLGFAASASQPQVIVLSVADALRAGRDAGEIRSLAGRLADGGFLVLDAQAVLGAPEALYLPLVDEERP